MREVAMTNWIVMVLEEPFSPMETYTKDIINTAKGTEKVYTFLRMVQDLTAFGKMVQI